jgi:hypothetical protein
VTNPILPLADLVARTRYADLPPRASEAAKTFILDTLGVGAGGAAAPRVAELVETAASWGAAGDGLGRRRKVPPARRHGQRLSIHALEWDCAEPAVHRCDVFSRCRRRRAARARAGERRGACSLGARVEVACTIGAARSPMRFFAGDGGLGRRRRRGRWRATARLTPSASLRPTSVRCGALSSVLGCRSGSTRAEPNAVISPPGSPGRDVLVGPWLLVVRAQSDIDTR